MDLPRADVDPGGLLEYSVVFTDRSLNHMSQRFVTVMQDLINVLRSTYHAQAVAVVPGGGSYAMEAVARQLATGQRCLIVRNGLFSHRWSQILTTGAIAEDVTICNARPIEDTRHAAWQPAPVNEVVAAIHDMRPGLVFAPHVETASGMMLPDDYLRDVAEATHAVGGLFVLDCIASGAMWVDMTELGVDVLLNAPQKGWSGTPCAGYVMLGAAAQTAVEASASSSFVADLGRWLNITQAYTRGETPYHATMPTDALARNAAAMLETRACGLQTLRQAQQDLGDGVRGLLTEYGFASVAAEPFASPSVVVVHTDDQGLHTGANFRAVGLQIAAGVPLMCDERQDFSTFRIGLFGLDKLNDVPGTVARFEVALANLGAHRG